MIELSQERLQALNNYQKPDRVPFVHKGYAFCARNIGYPLADIYETPERSFDAQWRTFQQYNADGTPFYTFSAYGSWEFGGEVEWPDDRWGSGPGVARRPISKPEELWDLKVPDPKTAGCVPNMIKFAHMQAENNFPIAFICGSPFAHAANLCGVQTFLQWTYQEPEAVHKALRLMTDHIISVARYFVDTFGPERLLPRATATTDGLISPSAFEQFALPYLQELHQTVLDMGIQSIYSHICGDHNHLLSLWEQVPFGKPGMLSLGREVDLLKAAKHFPDHIIAGHVDPSIIHQGSPHEIMEACRQNIEIGKQIEAGFVFMAGCEIPPTTPPYHVYLMSQAAEKYGYY